MAPVNLYRFYKKALVTGLAAGVAAASANTTAINAVLTTYKGTDTAVYLPEGDWYHNNAIVVDSVTFYGEPTSRLIRYDGTTSPAGQVKLIGVNPRLYWLTVSAQGSSVRGDQLYNHGVTQEAARGAVCEGVAVQGVCGAGLFNYGSIYSRFTNCTVNGSLADGVHFTNAAQYCESDLCSVVNSGDDFFAVVSYAGSICDNIQITNFSGRDQGATGRGATVVGGTNIRYRNGKLVNMKTRGIYVASEVAFGSDAVNNVTVDSVSVDTTGLSGGGGDPGWAGVWVGGRVGYAVSNVVMTNVTIKNAVTTKLDNGVNTSGINLAGVTAI